MSQSRSCDGSECLPGAVRRLLTYARLGVVTDALRKDCLELTSLTGGKPNLVEAEVDRHELAFQDIIRQWLARDHPGSRKRGVKPVAGGVELVDLQLGNLHRTLLGKTGIDQITRLCTIDLYR